jgi:hypothetical protein
MMDPADWSVDYALDRETHLKAVFDLPLPGKAMRMRIGTYLRDPDAHVPDAEALVGLTADAGLLSLLRSQGVQPRNMVALNDAGGIVMTRHGVRGLDTSMIGVPLHGRCPGHAFIGKGARWIATGEAVTVRFERRMRDLPSTILSMATGRPLVEMLSHRALDHLPYVVEGIEEQKHRTFVHLTGVGCSGLHD